MTRNVNDTEAQRSIQTEGNVIYRQSMLVIQSSKHRQGCKNHQPKKKWVCAENSSAKNTHSKLKNGQHADTATNAALACFSFYKRLTGTSE